MRVAVHRGRTGLVIGDRLLDVQRASGGAIPSDPRQMFHHWVDLQELASRAQHDPADLEPLDPAALDAPVPRPLQAFGIGVNYRDHASEAAMALPEHPMVFPKFPTSIAGPNEPVVTLSTALDWEAELVVVIATEAYQVSAEDAGSVIAGYTVGQDLSDREVQFEGGANPQFGLGKSAPGFGPIGPWVVSADEIGDAPQLDIRCVVDGVVKQESNTGQLIFGVPELITYLSSRVRLLPGDLVFTGTPAGVGWTRTPRKTLRPGSRVDTTIEGIGTLTTQVVSR